MVKITEDKVKEILQKIFNNDKSNFNISKKIHELNNGNTNVNSLVDIVITIICKLHYDNFLSEKEFVMMLLSLISAETLEGEIFKI